MPHHVLVVVNSSPSILLEPTSHLMRDDLRRGSDASTCFVVEKSRQQRWTFARGLSAMNYCSRMNYDAWSAAVRLHRKPARRLYGWRKQSSRSEPRQWRGRLRTLPSVRRVWRKLGWPRNITGAERTRNLGDFTAWTSGVQDEAAAGSA